MSQIETRPPRSHLKGTSPENVKAFVPKSAKTSIISSEMSEPSVSNQKHAEKKRSEKHRYVMIYYDIIQRFTFS